MNTIYINVESFDEAMKVADALFEESLPFTVDPVAFTVKVEHRLAVRLMRLYTRLTGKAPQHLGFPVVLNYSRL